MTPEEKAKELIEKFIPDTRQHDYHEGWQDNPDAAKQCALIAVEEILDDKEDALDVMNDAREITMIHNSMQYWQSVKTAITNL